MKKSFFFYILCFIFTGTLLYPATVQKNILTGKINKAKKYFSGKADINIVDRNGNTALHAAAQKNEPELITFLVLKGANTEIKNKEGNTPLHVAIKYNNYESAQTLTSLGADIFALDAKGTSALETALAKNEKYYDIMINEGTAQLRDKNNGNGIVHYFVLTRNKKAVDFCINKKLNIDNENFSKKTPLALALKNPDTLVCAEIAASLVLAGAKNVECDAKYFEEAVRQRNLSLRLSDGQTPLHLAAIFEHMGIAEYLLKNGADVKAQDISGTTPLHEAARYGQVKIVKQLILQGADVNGKDTLGKTPLLLLIPVEKQYEIYSILLANGANINQKDMYGDSVLHIASMVASSDEILELFIRYGADVNIRNKKGITPIVVSIEHSNARQVKFYANHGANLYAEDAKKSTPLSTALKRSDDLYKALIVRENVNSTDSEGNTPLIIALKNGANFSKIEYIVNLGSDVNARNRNGESALYMAVAKNNRKVGELLLSKDADIFAANTKDVSPLRLALEKRNGSEQWILNSKTILERDGSGNSVLHLAAEWRLSKGTLELIIQKGCDVDTVNANGETPLFSAAKADNIDSIEVLLKNSASIKARDNLGSSALHAAVRWNALSAAEKLVSYGIEIDSQNVSGKTPLYDSSVEGNLVMTNFLLSHGANPNTYDLTGSTCLTGAIKGNHYDVVKLLLASNANPQIQDLNGKTPYHEAAFLGDTEIIRALRLAGANPLTKDKTGTTPLSLTFGQDRSIMYAVLGTEKMIADSEGNTPVHIVLQKMAELPILKSLIANGYPFDTRNSYGYTPLSLATATGQKDAASLLLENGANPFAEIDSTGENAVTLAFKDSSGELLDYIVKYSGEKTDIRGNTILHYAARLSDEKTIRRLLNLGLEKNAKNVSNETPYDVAVSWEKKANAELLK